MTNVGLKFLALLALSGLSSGAIAHTLQQATSELVWRADTGLLEISHAFHLDDALYLMADLGHPEGEMTVQLQAKLLLYTEEHFGLAQDGQQLQLEALGAQVVGDFLWVYQEVQLSAPPSTIEVETTMLQAYFPQQRHQINLSIGDHVRTLHLSEHMPSGVYE